MNGLSWHCKRPAPISQVAAYSKTSKPLPALGFLKGLPRIVVLPISTVPGDDV